MTRLRAARLKGQKDSHVPTPLDECSAEEISAIQTHARHQQGFRTIIGLIRRLRECESNSDLYEFQQALLDELLAIEEHRLKWSRLVKWLGRGQSVPADAVEPMRQASPCGRPRHAARPVVVSRDMLYTAGPRTCLTEARSVGASGAESVDGRRCASPLRCG